MSMADSHCQRVRCVRFRDRLQSQQYAHHVLDLDFIGTTLAHDCLLDFAGGILVNRNFAAEGRAQRRGPRMPKLEGTVCVTVHEYPLDGYLLGVMPAYQFSDVTENDLKAALKFASAKTDGASLHNLQLIAPGGDYAKARIAGARVDAENCDCLVICSHGFTSLGRHALQHIVGKIRITVDILHVIKIFQCFQQLDGRLGIFAFDAGIGGWIKSRLGTVRIQSG